MLGHLREGPGLNGHSLWQGVDTPRSAPAPPGAGRGSLPACLCLWLRGDIPRSAFAPPGPGRGSLRACLWSWQGMDIPRSAFAPPGPGRGSLRACSLRAFCWGLRRAQTCLESRTQHTRATKAPGHLQAQLLTCQCTALVRAGSAGAAEHLKTFLMTAAWPAQIPLGQAQGEALDNLKAALIPNSAKLRSAWVRRLHEWADGQGQGQDGGDVRQAGYQTRGEDHVAPSSANLRVAAAQVR